MMMMMKKMIINIQDNEHRSDEWMQVQMKKGKSMINIFLNFNILNIVTKKTDKNNEDQVVHLLLKVYESYLLYILYQIF